MYFSKSSNLHISGHRDIDFIDRSLVADIPLFLDPSLIQGTQTEWCQKCHKKMDNFFTKAFGYCKTRSNAALYEILQFGREPNETGLGLSRNHPRGKGTGPDTLYQIFKGLDARVLGTPNGILLPSDMCVVVKNFTEDRMSDLTTNILRRELYEFTIQQCDKHNIQLSPNEIDLGPTWSTDSEQWERLMGRPLIADGKMVLLVPKSIVRHYYVYGTEQYISQYIMPARQQYHYENRTTLALKYDKNNNEYYGKPSKKDVYQTEVYGTTHKDYAHEYMQGNPDSIIDFRSSIMAHISAGKYNLSDAYLDYIVYKKSRMIS